MDAMNTIHYGEGDRFDVDRWIKQKRLHECIEAIEEGPPNLLSKIDEARKIVWDLPEWAEQAIERGKKKLLEKELKRIEEGELDVPPRYHAEKLLGPTESYRLEEAIRKGERALLGKYITRIRNGEVYLADHGDCNTVNWISISARSLAKKCGVGKDVLEEALKEGRPKRLDKYLQSIEKGDTYWAPDAKELAEEGGLDAGKVEKALEKWAGVVKQRELGELEEDLNRIKTGRWQWLIEPAKKLAEKYNIDPGVVEGAAAEGAERQLAKRANNYVK